MTVKPNSWHFRIASLYGQGDYYRSTNLCSYFWHFMFGVLLCAFAVFVSAALLYFVLLAPAFWIVLCIADWHLYAPEADAAVGLAAWVLFSGFVALIAYGTWRESVNRPFLPVPPPLREAYRGWKEKYCPVINVAE